MKKLSVLFAAIIVLTLAGYGAGTAKAAPPIDRHQLNASQCSGGTLVVNVTQQVLNDIDSGYFGYWAQDNYTRQIQIWQLTENTFCVLARYEGGFVTNPDDAARLASPEGRGRFAEVMARAIRIYFAREDGI